MANDTAPAGGGMGDGGLGAGVVMETPSAPVFETPAPAPEPVVTPEPAAPAADTPAPDATIPAETPPAEGDKPGGEIPVNPHEALLNEIDNLGTETAEKTPAGESQSTDALSKTEAGDATDDKTAAGDTQSEEDQAAATGDEAATDETATDQPAEEEIPDADWKKVPPDVEAHMKKTIPQTEWGQFRKAYRDGATLRSFMNPNCPPNVFVDNLAAKSGMRYSQVESEILKRNIEADPVAFLHKAFEATQDESGHSEPYKRLIDSTIATNPDYVQHVLASQGFKVTKAGDADTPAETNGHADLTNYTDEEIDGIKDSAAFQQFTETFPEDAEKISSVLDATKELKAKQSAEPTDADKAADAERVKTEQTAAEAQLAKYNGDFSSVYEASVTNHVNTKLDKEFGLAVSPEEKEKNPDMALLKEAKRKLILSGGLNGSGDFDNDLYNWGQDRPAFKAAAKAMVEYTRAGEKDNAAAAAKDLAPFAEMFLAERMKLPEVAQIDKLIQMLAKQQKAGLDVREEQAPNSPLSQTTAGGAAKSFHDEIDMM